MTFDKWFRGYTKRNKLTIGETQVAAPIARAAWDALARDVARFMDREERDSDASHAFEATRTYLAP